MRKNERDIQFNVDAYTAKLIGRENVSKLEGAVLEIVKNAYDADAKIFCLYYSEQDNCIYIIDNGIGMDEEVLREHWMTIGNSSKKKDYKTQKNRIQTGAKGIGRFALDRISDRCEMLTITQDGGLEWVVNWEDFSDAKKLSDVTAKLYDSDESLLEYAQIYTWKNFAVAKELWELQWGNTGTVFRLYDLHDEWNEKAMEKLRNHLENLLPPDVVEDFDIYFFDDETEFKNAQIISANVDSFDYKIEFFVEGEQLKIGITRNEFDFGDEEERILKEANIDKEEQKYFHGTVKSFSFSFPEIGEKKNVIGNYKGILYFNKISATKEDTEKFYYKDIKGRKNFTKEFGGIKLYRDHFRVRPYGEYGDNDFDWLELAPRVRRSPAGLGHPHGKWRVSSEQMIGVVEISRKNRNLEDAANRNGIQEGEGFEQLKRVLLAVIQEFERDRQSIGRKLAQYRKEQDELQAEIERLRKLAEERRHWEEEQKKKQQEQTRPEEQEKSEESEPDGASSDESEAPTISPEDVENLVDSLQARQEEEIKDLQDEAKMLQTLATTGIVTNMFMHEIRTLTNNIGQELDAAFEAIKYDRDIDEALANVKQAIEFKKHFASWFSVTIDSIRKDKRKRRVHNISVAITDFLENWKAILQRNDVRLIPNCDDNINFKCFIFDIENIISNLISNSLFSFDKENDQVLAKKEIYLRIEKREEGFILFYEDTGWGLSSKYKKRPDLITEAFESDRSNSGREEDEDGTGMGMWIVKRTILEYNGDIDLSANKAMETGFKAVLSFGGKYV